jgi:hypothetical protein
VSALLVTILVSTALAGGFVAFFLHLQRRRQCDPLRDALLPLEDRETPVPHKSPASKTV